jgi:multidrug resistance efflux pump
MADPRDVDPLSTPPLEAAPKLARGVEALPSSDPDVLSIRTATGDTITLHQSDWRVAQLMDGTRSIPQLSQAARGFGFPSSEDEMRHLVRQFEAYGILEPKGAVPQAVLPWTASATDVPVTSPLPYPGDGPPLQPTPSNIDTTNLLSDLASDPPKEDFQWPAPRAPKRRPTVEDENTEADVELVDEQDLPLPPPPEPADAPELTPEPSYDDRPRRRRGGGRAKWVLALLFIGALGAGLVPFPVRQPARLSALKKLPVVAEQGGRVEKVHKKEGDRVRAGEPLLTLKGVPPGPQLAQLKEELAARQKALTEKPALVAAKPSSSAELKKTVLQKRRKAFAAANRLRDLRDSGEASDEDLEEAQLELQLLRKELAAAMAEAAGKKAPPPPPPDEGPLAPSAELQALEAKIAELSAQSEGVLVASPGDGILVGAGLSGLTGTQLKPGESVAEVFAVDALEVEVLASEDLLYAFTPKQEMVVHPDALPKRSFPSVVERVSPNATLDPMVGRAVFRVVGMVKNEDGLLKDGMTGYVEVEGVTRSLLSRAAADGMKWIHNKGWM